MEQTTVLTEYAVGLNREEYMYSQALASKAIRGNALFGSRIISVVMMVLCVLAVVFDRKLSGVWDMSLLAIVLLMIGADLWVFFTAPAQPRRQNGQIYDKTRFQGYSFDGIVMVDDRGISKKNRSEQTTIPFSHCAAFIEDAEMMLFWGVCGKSIVIPKRFLTAEDAELTRQAALAAIAPSRCYLFGRVEAQLTERLPLPEEGVPAPEEPLLQIAVQYTPKELKAQAVEMSIRAYAQKMPKKTLTAVLVTILAYFCFEIPPLPTFLLCSVLLFLFSVLGARLRIGTMLAASDGAISRIEFTETAIRIRGKGEPLTVPWNCVTRAVEAPNEVEFYVSGDKAFSIPKRCVEDMSLLRRLVDTHLSA